MLTRSKLRTLAIDALKAAPTLAGNAVFIYDWPTNIRQTPIAILVNHDYDVKISNSRTVPNFTSTPELILDLRCEDVTVEKARWKLDTLLDQVEQVIFTNYAIVKAIQQFSHVETKSQITSESDYHVASALMRIGMETFEIYQPTGIPIKEMTVSVDLQNIFDPTGTYVDPLFPGSGTPAPRTTGPDERLEGYVQKSNLDE